MTIKVSRRLREGRGCGVWRTGSRARAPAIRPGCSSLWGWHTTCSRPTRGELVAYTRRHERRLTLSCPVRGPDVSHRQKGARTAPYLLSTLGWNRRHLSEELPCELPDNARSLSAHPPRLLVANYRATIATPPRRRAALLLTKPVWPLSSHASAASLCLQMRATAAPYM